MTTFCTHINGDPQCGTLAYDEDLTVSISTDAEDGHDVRGGCSWLNSASVFADPDRDQVAVRISVADPNGGLCMTVRRLDDGTLLLHVPHERESLPHVELTELHAGTYRIGSVGAYADAEEEEE